MKQTLHEHVLLGQINTMTGLKSHPIHVHKMDYLRCNTRADTIISGFTVPIFWVVMYLIFKLFMPVVYAIVIKIFHKKFM